MEPGKGVRGTITAKDNDVFSWMDPGVPRDMGGFDYARVELTGVPGIDLAIDVLDGDGKRVMTVNDGGPGEYEVIPNVGVEPAHTYYFRVHEAGPPKGDATHAYELTVQTWPAAVGRRARAERRRRARDAGEAGERDDRRRQRLFRAQARRGLAEPVAGGRAGQGRARDPAARAGAGGGRGAVAEGDRRERQGSVRRGARRQERRAAAAQRRRRRRRRRGAAGAARGRRASRPRRAGSCASASSRRWTAPSASRTTTSRTRRR